MLTILLAHCEFAIANMATMQRLIVEKILTVLPENATDPNVTVNTVQFCANPNSAALLSTS